MNKAGGRPTTPEDWLKAFVLGGIGYGAGRGLNWLGKKHNVNLSSGGDRGRWARTARLQAVHGRGVRGPGYGLGFVSDAAKGRTAAELSELVTAMSPAST